MLLVRVIPLSKPLFATPVTAVAPICPPRVSPVGKGNENVIEEPTEDPSFVASSWEASYPHAHPSRGQAQSEPLASVDAQAKYVSNWDIRQGDVLMEPELCRAFMKLVFPTAERMRQSRSSLKELSDHVALSWVTVSVKNC